MPPASLSRTNSRPRLSTRWKSVPIYSYCIAGCLATTAFAQGGRGVSAVEKPTAAGTPPIGSLFIKEYRVRGNPSPDPK